MSEPNPTEIKLLKGNEIQWRRRSKNKRGEMNSTKRLASLKI